MLLAQGNVRYKDEDQTNTHVKKDLKVTVDLEPDQDAFFFDPEITAQERFVKYRKE